MMTGKTWKIFCFARSRTWLAAAALAAAISVPGTALASRGIEVTVVFSQDGRTVMTVTTPAGMPVRYEWVADTGGDATAAVGSKTRNITRSDKNTPHLDTTGTIGAEPAPSGRLARGAKAAYIVSTTGLRIIKSALFSMVTSLAQLYSDA